MNHEEVVQILNKISEEGGKIAMTAAAKLEKKGRQEERLENNKKLIVRFFVDKGFQIDVIADLLEVEEHFVIETLKEKGLLN